MILKRNKKELDSVEERNKEVKKILRNRRIKKALCTGLIVVGLIGGYVGLFKNPNVKSDDILENKSFVENYTKTYFSFPKTKESTEYLKMFSLSYTDLEFKEVESSIISDAVIYNVEDIQPNVKAYYLKIKQSIIKQDKTKKNIDLNIRLDVASLNGMYSVVRPVKMTGKENKAIIEEEKKDFEFETKEATSKCSEQERSQVEDTIKLFYETYVINYDQANLLMEDKTVLEQVDKNTKFTLLGIESISKNDNEFYVVAKVKQTTSDLFSKDIKVFFEIDIIKNKIKTMEVY
ncbi:MAG: conjugal transfer protein [Erysipelotrichaceae bacterium]